MMISMTFYQISPRIMMFFTIIVHILMLLMVTYVENRPFSLAADSVKMATIEKFKTPRIMFPKGLGMKINHQNAFLKPIPRDYRAGTGLIQELSVDYFLD